MGNESYLRWNVITNVLMALSINTTAVLLGGGSSLADWFLGCCGAFTLNTVASVVFPMGKIIKWFVTDVCKQTSGFPEMLARNFIVNAIYVTFVSFCMAIIHVGLNGSTVGVWLQTYFQLHIVGLITGLIIEKPVAAINKALG